MRTKKRELTRPCHPPHYANRTHCILPSFSLLHTALPASPVPRSHYPTRLTRPSFTLPSPVDPLYKLPARPFQPIRPVDHTPVVQLSEGRLKMASRKAAAVIVMVMLSIVQQAFGAGECGKTPVNVVAQSLSPCLGAANNAKAKVAPACCAQVTKTLAMPKCLCAVFLSPLAKQAGINLGTAITIPKRCNIKNRPVGKKCGRYVVP